MSYYQLRIEMGPIADVIVGLFGTVVVLTSDSLALYPDLPAVARAHTGAILDPIDPTAERKAAIAKRLRVARRKIDEVLMSGSAVVLPSLCV